MCFDGFPLLWQAVSRLLDAPSAGSVRAIPEENGRLKNLQEWCIKDFCFLVAVQFRAINFAHFKSNVFSSVPKNERFGQVQLRDGQETSK